MIASTLLGVALQAQVASHVVVVGGIGGEPRFRERFNQWATTLIAAAEERFDVPRENIHYLAERTDVAPGRVEARSTRENLSDLVTRLASSAGPTDRVVLVMFGHGSDLNGATRFNLPGPDISPEELAVMLGTLGDRPVTVVNTASSSGGFLPALSAPGRVVITSTRSGRERNNARFGGFFAAAFATPDADTDKDNLVSMLEAFNYARLETERSYSGGNRIQSEHALLDDNGDGEGSQEPDPLSGGDGALARRTFLSGGIPVLAGQPSDDPELAALYQNKASLEEAIQELRARKSTMSEDDFDDQLEELILELATITRAIQEKEGTE